MLSRKQKAAAEAAKAIDQLGDVIERKREAAFATHARIRVALLSDDDHTNPRLLFQQTDQILLLAIAEGMIDPVRMAQWELASRGLDANGKWVGFAEAQRIHGAK
jgi:hypothetical protein